MCTLEVGCLLAFDCRLTNNAVGFSQAATAVAIGRIPCTRSGSVRSREATWPCPPGLARLFWNRRMKTVHRHSVAHAVALAHAHARRERVVSVNFRDQVSGITRTEECVSVRASNGTGWVLLCVTKRVWPRWSYGIAASAETPAPWLLAPQQPAVASQLSSCMGRANKEHTAHVSAM